jgi:hypothetical protein
VQQKKNNPTTTSILEPERKIGKSFDHPHLLPLEKHCKLRAHFNAPASRIKASSMLKSSSGKDRSCCDNKKFLQQQLL